MAARTIAVAWLGLVLAVGAVRAADDHLGLTEYELACMPCHGINGRGDGPLGRGANPPPSDLSTIARRTGGRFPFARVRAAIDGRDDVRAHGPRTMPVWGNRYRRRSDPLDSASAIERSALRRIDSLVRYLKSIQR